jgi:AraC-like DNA-binding protein
VPLCFHVPMWAYRKPRPPLDAFVKVIWVYESYAPATPLERILPDGGVELVVPLSASVSRFGTGASTGADASVTGGVVCGPHLQSFLIDTSQPETVAGIHFWPGGAFPFFREPAGELFNQHVALEDLWGHPAGWLWERLLSAPAPEDRLTILEETLVSQLAKPMERHGGVRFALRQFSDQGRRPTVAAVTEQIGMSARCFIEAFRNEVGMTPKAYCRVRRFQRIIRSAWGQREVDWAAVASECGYYDQAHFIHDFKGFCGLTPAVYLARRGRHPSHVPVPT